MKLTEREMNIVLFFVTAALPVILVLYGWWS